MRFKARRLLKAKSAPVGRIVRTRMQLRPTQSGWAIEQGLNALLIVHVRPSRRWLKDFAFRCRALGINQQPLNSGWRWAFECAGLPQALITLMACKCVLESHFALNVKAPHSAAGAGEVKTRSTSKRSNKRGADIVSRPITPQNAHTAMRRTEIE